MKILGLSTLTVCFATCALQAQDNAPTRVVSPMKAAAAPSVSFTPSQKPGQTAFALMSPPAAQTFESIAVVWDKIAGVEGYDVFQGGTLVATTKNTDYTFHGLAASREYEIVVRTHVSAGTPLQSNTIRVSTKPQPKMFDITAHGAVGDGKTLNTRAIQAAIDACSPGGMIRIPAGTFRCGAIFLKSDLTLHLDNGATLLGSADTVDYPVMKYRHEGRELDCYASLINTPDTKDGVRWRDITITGPGKIDANGSPLRQRELAEHTGKPGCAICIRDTDGVCLQDFTVQQPPFWCVQPIYCNGVTVNGVGIHTRYDETGKKYPGIVNGDGLDPDSCRDVFIFNCEIASQDDCIALKSGRDEEGRKVGIPTENVRISNCLFNSGFGVAMGSEMAGGLRNVLVEDCVFRDAFSIASVKAIRGRGNMIENIVYRDCTLINQNKDIHDGPYFRGAIYVDQFYGAAKPDLHTAKPKDETTPLIRNVLFQNIKVDTVGGNAIYLAGLPENPLENIRLVNVTAVGKHGLIATNINGLVRENLSIQAREGEAMQLDNVK